MKLISLGVVGRPFGIRGEIKVKLHNPDSDWFEHAEEVLLRRSKDDEPERFPVLKAKRHKEFVVLSLKGVRDRNQSEQMRGWEVVAPEDGFPELPEDEFYWHQLIGLKVMDTQGDELGEVVRLESTAPELGGNDVLVVVGSQGELLIPMAESAVKKVDLGNGRITVDTEAVL